MSPYLLDVAVVRHGSKISCVARKGGSRVRTQLELGTVVWSLYKQTWSPRIASKQLELFLIGACDGWMRALGVMDSRPGLWMVRLCTSVRRWHYGDVCAAARKKHAGNVFGTRAYIRYMIFWWSVAIRDKNERKRKKETVSISIL